MYKILFTFIVTVGLSLGLYAAPNAHMDDRRQAKPMSAKKIQKMDHRHSKHKAVKRKFKTKRDFEHRAKRAKRSISGKHINRQYDRYDNGYNYSSNTRKNARNNTYRQVRQRGNNRGNRGWTLAYRYDRASFYDNEGYYYGYFNRHGYYFEDMFYRYDRHYTYKDRTRGRGLFDHRYYMPTKARHYGFCDTHNNRGYDDRY